MREGRAAAVPERLRRGHGALEFPAAVIDEAVRASQARADRDGWGLGPPELERGLVARVARDDDALRVDHDRLLPPEPTQRIRDRGDRRL